VCVCVCVCALPCLVCGGNQNKKKICKMARENEPGTVPERPPPIALVLMVDSLVKVGAAGAPKGALWRVLCPVRARARESKSQNLRTVTTVTDR
jgi:hypothetical protein